MQTSSSRVVINVTTLQLAEHHLENGSSLEWYSLSEIFLMEKTEDNFLSSQDAYINSILFCIVSYSMIGHIIMERLC